MKLRIDGIYDLRTLEASEENSIDCFSFDFRPLSLNYYQQHRFLDLLKNIHSTKHKYFMHFANEADFVLEKCIEDISEYPQDNFILEFSDVRKLNFYDQFKFPFYLHYSDELEINVFQESKYLNGIIFDFEFFNELYKKDEFYNFVTTFFNSIGESHNYKFILRVDWGSDIFPSLFEFFNFEYIALPINSKVETCYRNVDIAKLNAELGVLF